MIKKSDIVREAVQKQDWKKALQVAKDFHIGVTQDQRSKMARAYECIVHPDFYRQIGIDIPEAIEQGKAVVKEYAESARRKNTMMKWDVKHDRAKRIIDAFLENAGYWQEREDLAEGLTDEEKALVNEELVLMITSIRKRYKLEERLTEKKTQIELQTAETEIPTVEVKETLPAPVNEAEKEEKSGKEEVMGQTEESAEKPQRGRKASRTEKKSVTKRGRQKENMEGEA